METMKVTDFEIDCDNVGMGAVKGNKGLYYPVTNFRDNNNCQFIYWNIIGGRVLEGKFVYTKYEKGECTLTVIPNDACVVKDGEKVYICTDVVERS